MDVKCQPAAPLVLLCLGSPRHAAATADVRGSAKNLWRGLERGPALPN